MIRTERESKWRKEKDQESQISRRLERTGRVVHAVSVAQAPGGKQLCEIVCQCTAYQALDSS